jgi:hypothetical protein
VTSAGGGAIIRQHDDDADETFDSMICMFEILLAGLLFCRKKGWSD